MADVILEADIGYNAVRQRHQASSEPREFNNPRQIRRTDSSEGFDFMFGEFEHAGGSSMLASSPPGLAERIAEEDPNTPPRSMLSLLDSSNGISGSSFSSSSSCDLQTSSSPLELDETDFECSLCYRIFYQPVTTSCGHTYCKGCLSSSLKFSFDCPICRRRLCSSQDELDLSVSYVISNVVEKHFPIQLEQRMQEEKETKSCSSSSAPLSSSAPSVIGARNHIMAGPEPRQVQSIAAPERTSERRRSSSIGWWSDCLGGCTFLYPLDL
eukprot:TRINITY_DN1434_c0_g1_i1.p1 TRINITY_DN1434_c0_g1~~TRINITY_DN1434_c0_g1_i1.p1  ORF type:complete len:269 (-),score=31.13 TRINITY_DN1434_c0_g1_i1:76-882(-)